MSAQQTNYAASKENVTSKEHFPDLSEATFGLLGRQRPHVMKARFRLPTSIIYHLLDIQTFSLSQSAAERLSKSSAFYLRVIFLLAGAVMSSF